MISPHSGGYCECKFILIARHQGRVNQQCAGRRGRTLREVSYRSLAHANHVITSATRQHIGKLMSCQKCHVARPKEQQSRWMRARHFPDDHSDICLSNRQHGVSDRDNCVKWCHHHAGRACARAITHTIQYHAHTTQCTASHTSGESDDDKLQLSGPTRNVRRHNRDHKRKIVGEYASRHGWHELPGGRGGDQIRASASASAHAMPFCGARVPAAASLAMETEGLRSPYAGRGIHLALPEHFRFALTRLATW